MIENRNVSIITDMEGKTIVQINEIRFKGKRNIDWDGVKDYLKGFVRDQYTVDETGDTIYIGNPCF